MQLLLSSVCLAFTCAVIGNAYYQKKQFYPAVVHITKSNASMAVIYVQFFVIVCVFFKLLRRIFLGTLRAAEFEHLLERFWYAITETCLAFTVFRDDFNPRFVALFTVLLFLKSFHWLAEERVDFMERSPILGWLFHIRVASLLAVLGGLDYLLLMHAYTSTLEKGPTVQLVFGFEYAILLTVIASIAIKYVLHTAEMRTDSSWENKAVFLLYTELVIGLIKVILYIFFVIIMVKIYALPMFIFRPMFFTLRNFKKALSDVIMSRRAIRNLNTLYPDATPEELTLSDNICIICREDMVSHAKKLPCGHIFHTNCLRSWFQRQQTCPTCRMNILRTPTVNTAAQNAAAAAAAAPAPAAPGQQNNAQPNIGIQGQQPIPGNVPIQIPAAVFAAAGLQIPQVINTAPATGTQPQDGPLASTSNVIPATNIPGATFTGTSIPTVASASAHSGQTIPGFDQMLNNFQMFNPANFMLPPPFIPPYPVPPPPMPDDLTQFSIEDLKEMEGNQRKNIEERLKLLRNIELMLNAAGTLMSNYQLIAPPRPPIPTPASGATIPTPTATATTIPTPTATATTVPTPNATAASTTIQTSSGSLTTAKETAAPTGITAAIPTSSTNVRSIDEINDDIPTTSREAAQKLAAAAASKPASTVDSKIDPSKGLYAVPREAANVKQQSTISSTNNVDKLNMVTVEDLIGDEEQVSSSSTLSSGTSKQEILSYLDSPSTSVEASTTADTIPPSLDPEEAKRLLELRKKRIKYLEELGRNNQSSA